MLHYADDDKDEYMNAVLRYCRNLLRRWNAKCRSRQQEIRLDKKKVTRRPTSRQGVMADKPAPTDNCKTLFFSKMQLDEDSDTEDVSDNGNLWNDLERPRPPLDNKDNKSWTLRSHLFFKSRRAVRSRTRCVQKTWREMDDMQASSESSDYKNHWTLVALLQCTCAVNVVVDRDEYMERCFLEMNQTPTKTSERDMHDVLAVMLFPRHMRQLEEVLGEKAVKTDPARLVSYIAACIKMGFVGYDRL